MKAALKVVCLAEAAVLLCVVANLACCWWTAPVPTEPARFVFTGIGRSDTPEDGWEDHWWTNFRSDIVVSYHHGQPRYSAVLPASPPPPRLTGTLRRLLAYVW